MTNDDHKPPSNMPVSLRPQAALQLSEMAQHYGQCPDEFAAIAIHMAYLRYLEEKREGAMRSLNLYLGQPEFDDEIPF